MKNTRFMEAMFSAVDNNDEELTRQVANDIENAKANGTVDTDEIKYESVGDGTVKIIDKGTGEVTIAQKASDEADTYDLNPAVPDVQLEKFLHPTRDGHIGKQTGSPDEYAEGHLRNDQQISRAGEWGNVEDTAQEGPEGDEKEFSVASDNTVVQRVFSDQEFCERLFSEVIDSEDTAVVGDLKVEKIPEEDHTVVVTDETTGDQAKVTLDDDEMQVTELESKNLSDRDFSDYGDGSGYDPLHVVGVDASNHTIVDAPEYTEESAQELQRRLTEDGVDAVQIFDNAEDARDYAFQLLSSLGASEVGEPEQAEYSDHMIYLTDFNADNTQIMCRMFSEATLGIADTRNKVEDAIESGDQIETDDEVITPVDAITAVVEDKDNGEFTKATVDGTDMKLEHIDEDEADDITGNLSVIESESGIDDNDWDDDDDDEDDDDECDQKECSDIYTDDTETRYFSENEDFTAYMQRLYSCEADEEEVADAIESGEEVENDNEVITPVDSKTAVVEDKETGEFTKATLDGDDSVEVHPIDEDEAEELTKDTVVDKDSEKDYSDIYTDDTETRYFSENEDFTAYMQRLFTGDADEEDVADAIENGDEIETEDEVITPVDSKTAVVEDKETGEFTKATLDEDGKGIETKAIDEDEADDLTKDVKVDEDSEEDEDEKVHSDETGTRYFSDDEEFTDFMERIFSDDTKQDAIEDAIENGDQLETEEEVITPVDNKTAVVEDKGNGEFTKVTITPDEEGINVHPISEDEADDMTEGLRVAKEAEDEDTGEKQFADTYAEDPVLDKFFADIAMGQVAPAGPQAPAPQPAAVDAYGNPIADPNQQVVPDQNPNGPVTPTVEDVEDKATAAVQAINAAAAEASATIAQAKAAPAPNAEPDLQEAQFSDYDDYFDESELEDRLFSDTDDTLVSWIDNIHK